MAQDIAYYHHEKWNGKSYLGLAGEAIPESARISALADVFDALTMKQPYKDPWPLNKAFNAIRKDAREHFDPTLAEIFLSIRPEIEAIKARFDAQEKEQAEAQNTTPKGG